MMRAALRAGLTLMVCLVCAVALPAAEQINISAGVAGTNTKPEFAIDHRNGNVLIVWTNADPDSGNTSIWGRLARRTSAGYKLKKAFRISADGSTHANADVVFVSANKEFLVAWDTAVEGAALTPSSILARVVSDKGKNKGDVRTLVGNGRRNMIPRLAVALPGDVTPANHDDLVRTIYTSYPTPNVPTGGGVNYAALDSFFDIIPATERTAIPINLDPPGSGTPTFEDLDRWIDITDMNILTLQDDRFRVQANWCGYKRESNGHFVPDNGLLWFFDEENVDVLVKVLNGGDLNPHSRFWVFTGSLTNVEYSLTVTDTVEGHTIYRTPLNNPFQPVTDTQAFATCPSLVVRHPSPRSVTPPANSYPSSDLIPYFTDSPGTDGISPAAKIKFGQVIYALDGMVRAQNFLINAKGRIKLAKTVNPLFSFTGTLTALRGEWHAPTNTRFILWGRLLTFADQQVWLQIS